MRRLLVLLVSLGLVFGVVSLATATSIQSSGIWSGNNHEYIVVGFAPGESKIWDSAFVDVWFNYPDYYLATITSAPEQAFIESLFAGGDQGEYWLGGYQFPFNTAGVGDNWTWYTGEPFLSYTNWNPGEPNDAYGSGSEQHLAMWGLHGWRWNDEGNTDPITGYVAERSVPEPATLLLLGSGLVGLAVFGRRKLRKT